ncbi:MAG: DegT/DnrJ/EryC1/StrS family aminotransferase [Bacteroidota bacterium]
MKEIRMVDLHGQYLHIKTEIDQAIQEVIDQTSFIKGPAVSSFEQELAEYLGARGVVACANGTDALQVAMMALGLEPGDEVITTPFTFIATVEVIRLLRLKPVLADVNRETFNIDPEQLLQVLTPRTKAIVPVHLFGQCADMERIMKIAAEYGLHVIEDTAQATGAEYTFSDGRTVKAGLMGTIGTTSFFPSKNLGCYGDGGALFSNDQALLDKLKAIINHGMNRRYYYDLVGVNSRLDTMQAAILRAKLPRLDQYNRAREEAAEYYNNSLQGIPALKIPFRDPRSTHIYHQYTLQIMDDSRDELKKYLEHKNIPSMIYYPVGLHLQKAYEDLGYKEGDFPVTEELCRRVLSLPMHTELDKEQLQYITGSIRDFYNGVV